MQRIYLFGGQRTDGSAGMKEQLGGKGANLAEMASLGLPVPPGFTITTAVCREFLESGEVLPEGVMDEVTAAVRDHIESAMGRAFGDAANPLLLSVRSGAPASMPGMMDTVLNLGLSRESVEGLAASGGGERFAWDAYRRFVMMYSDVVLGVSRYGFERAIEEVKHRRGYQDDTDLSVADWKVLCDKFETEVKKQTGTAFPQDPQEQLRNAVAAVFKSWNTPRAVYYRKLNDLSDDMGTAVNVQAMVFGNMGDDCATGVAFTRDPATGARVFFGEYLPNAQGEDVVAGIRTPFPINTESAPDGAERTLEEDFPEAYSALCEVRETLEKHYRDMQDLEFTVEHGKLYMLQTRTGKRTAAAAVRIAVELAEEGSISKEEALSRVSAEQVEKLLHPTLDPSAEHNVVAKGLPASPGAAVGRIVLDADQAVRWADRGEQVILVRAETSPEDIHGMHAADGILTARGGQTSHAAVVARGMGKCCIVGCRELTVHRDHITLRNERFEVGDTVTLNGSSGEIMRGALSLIRPDLSGEGPLSTILRWADEMRRLGVRANADTPDDAKTARTFGAGGIGLCRTEHMFFEGERIDRVRAMILADESHQRRAALSKLLPMQRSDFEAILEAMDGLPVTIRLLDPPLHEFLPRHEEELRGMAERLGLSVAFVRERVEAIAEFNPMLGHRGCRLGVTAPEIYDMQVRAVAEATVKLLERGLDPQPEIMIPLIATVQELALLRERAEAVLAEVFEGVDREPPPIGTMIELPRAALTAGDIAASADFFSFGTNDLTQTTFGLSRDDGGSFLPHYKDVGIVAQDPFVSIDIGGVGRLVRIACEEGRAAKPDLKIGVCGEHGGDPASVHFFDEVGLDYVSCSPFRVPVARLVAAQATIGASGPEND